MGKLKELSRTLTKKRKILVGLMVLVALVGGCALYTTSHKSAPTGLPVTTAPLAQKTILETVALKAPLEGTESVEVVSNKHYEVTQIHVKEGDHVKKGQVLATLDSKAMQNDIEVAQNAVELAQLQYQEKVKSTQAAYDKALEDLKNAQIQYGRTKALYEAGGVALEAYEKDASALKVAQSTVNTYQVSGGGVVGSDADRKNIEITQKTLAMKQEAYADAEIKSTIDGTVTRVNIKVGRFADETDDKKPMFVIENLDQLQMKVKVSEYDIAKIAEGQSVVISADVLGGATVAGVVTRISPTGEQKDATSTERVIPIVISVTESNEQLIAGITAKADIEIAKAEQAWVVPIEALVTKADGTMQILRVGANNMTEAIPVTLGVENDLEVQVTGEGLNVGDKIILSPGELVAGTAVTVINQ